LYYHYAILLLFRPFIKLRFLGSSVSPRDVSLQAADAITTLVRSYDQLYTLHRTPSFVPYIVLAASVMHLVAGSDSRDEKQIVQATSDLRDLCRTHGFSNRALEILRYLSQEWDMDNIMGEENPPTGEQIREACTPLTSSMNLFCPNMGAVQPDTTPGSAVALFSPFPMQGRPVLACTDEELERDGFARAT